MRRRAAAVKEPTPDLLKDVTPQAEKVVEQPPAKAKKEKVATLPAVRTAARETRTVAPGVPNLMAVLADAAANKDIDAGKMRALLDMRKEIRAEEARDAFVKDYVTVSGKLPIINATGRIVIEAKAGSTKKAQRTPYATFNEIHRIITPILKRHGFAIDYAPDYLEDGRLVMRAELSHIAGHSKTARMVLPLETSGSKNNVQGVGSSIAYGKRYLTITMLNLVSHASEDADDDGVAAGKLADQRGQAEVQIPATITPHQLVELTAAIEWCGIKQDRVLEKYDIKTLADLPVTMFKDALAACRNFAEAKKAKQ